MSSGLWDPPCQDANHGILDVELSQESLDGETEVTELWSVQTAEEALAIFG